MAQRISFEQATALAKSGDAEAQYALSSLLHQRGTFGESLHWLRLAADQKLVPAQMTLAMFLIDGRHCARDLQQAADLLHPLAVTQIQSNLLLGELYGFGALKIGDREVGLRYLAAAARMGDPGALRQLALLSCGHHRWDLALPLLAASAQRGDAAAAFALARCYTDGIGGAPDLARAASLSRNEAVRGLYLARRLERRWERQNVASPDEIARPSPVDWTVVEESLPMLACYLPLPEAEILHERPLIRRFAGVLHDLLLDSLINMAAPRVQPSQIVDARTGERRADPMRDSWHVTLGPREHDHVVEAIERCISRVSGLPALNSEFLQILRYRVGEQFKPHVDYFNESGAGSYRSLAEGGQRAQTVLGYLNADYDGGGTHFPRLNLTIKGRSGDLLQFHNLGPDGTGDRDSLHAGMPVAGGEKWLLSQWIRTEPYPARLAW